MNGRRVYQNRGETLRWLQETPPRCSLKLLDRLFVIYDGLFQYYKNDQDKTLAKAAWAKAGFAQTWIKRIKDWKAKDAKAVEEGITAKPRTGAFTAGIAEQLKYFA